MFILFVAIYMLAAYLIGLLTGQLLESRDKTFFTSEPIHGHVLCVLCLFWPILPLLTQASRLRKF